MPSSTRQSAFVHNGDWNEESRADPSQLWMEQVVREIFDAHKWDTPYSDIYTDDLTLLKPDGSEVKGGEAAWAAIAQLYSPFATQRTEPVYLVSTETDYGWQMVGTANIFGNLPGQPAAGETKVQDGQGTDWDVKMSGGFRFQYKTAAGAKYHGLLLQMVQIMSDSGPVVAKMIGRGFIKASDLGL